MGVGRFFCVAMPFALTLASLVCILIVMISGINVHSNSMFTVKTQNLSISSSDFKNLENALKVRSLDDRHLVKLATALETSVTGKTSVNFTANDLGLADSYKVFLWNYCETNATTKKETCSAAKFNWAHTAVNTTYLNQRAATVAQQLGQNVTLPKDIKVALDSFATVSKWTQVVYIIALIFCVLEIVVGCFGFCSRAGSCVTYLVAGFATTFIIAASALSTVASAVVVAAVQSTARAYNVHASIQTQFLSITWLAVAFSIGAGLFWLFSVCCCKSDSRGKKGEKFAARNGNYTPLDGTTSYLGHQQPAINIYNAGQRVNTPVRGGGGYEPYKTSAV